MNGSRGNHRVAEDLERLRVQLDSIPNDEFGDLARLLLQRQMPGAFRDAMALTIVAYCACGARLPSRTTKPYKYCSRRCAWKRYKHLMRLELAA